MRKTLYTLNVGDYAPEIRALTYPLMQRWARKIGAEFVEITERRFMGWPVVYEKLQIQRLGEERGDDWSLYLDADALVHPETPDWTCFLARDTIAHNGIDMGAVRWRYDAYFQRDGRNVGCCNWNTIASAWCRDLWTPLDITLAEALEKIHPTVDEEATGLIDPAHLIDDYALSRNVARYGLKVQTLVALEKQLGFKDAGFYWHAYTIPVGDYTGVKTSKPYTDGFGSDQGASPVLDAAGEPVPELQPGKVTSLRRVLKRWRVSP
jgi:hypothetical protein